MSKLEDISDAFVAARRVARALNAFPGDVPLSLETAYAVQARSIRKWGEPVAGYKVGGVAPSWRKKYPSPWLAGPIFSSVIHVAKDNRETIVPVFDGGFAAYEPELIFRLAGLKNQREPIRLLEDAKAYVQDIHLGAEIASSPLATLNALGPGSIISDFGNQAGIILGPSIGRDWIDRLDQIRVTTIIDQKQVGCNRVNDTENGPLGALRFLLNHLQDYPPDGLPDSLWLSSGAITGVHEASIGSSCVIRYEDLGNLEIAMIAKNEMRPE